VIIDSGAVVRNTAKPALPGRWCCPLEGGFGYTQ